MPSTSTDTPMPSATARPNAARVRPASGASIARSGATCPGTHTMAQPTTARIQARDAHARRGPVATKSGTAAATRSPHIAHPAPDGPEWNRSDVGEVEVGPEREAE